MSIFSKWFGNKSLAGGQPVAATKRVFAPNTKIPYHPTLIDELKSDHQELGAIFSELVSSVRTVNAQGVKAALERFEGALYAHLLKEKTSFYIYLRGIYAQDEGMLELVNHFSREMDGIQREVMKFLRKYKDTTLSPDELKVMSNELGGLGKALTNRIEREESQLYPQYLSPDTAGL